MTEVRLSLSELQTLLYQEELDWQNASRKDQGKPPLITLERKRMDEYYTQLGRLKALFNRHTISTPQYYSDNKQ